VYDLIFDQHRRLPVELPLLLLRTQTNWQPEAPMNQNTKVYETPAVLPVLFLFLLAGCGTETETAAPSERSRIESAAAPCSVTAPASDPACLGEEYWQYRLIRPRAALRFGPAADSIRQLREALEEAAFAKDMMERLALIEAGQLDHEQMLAPGLAWELNARIKRRNSGVDVTPQELAGISQPDPRGMSW
jgi:hypothetical protein